MSDVVIGRDIPSYHGVVAVSHYCSFCNTEIPPHICPKMQEAIESDNKIAQQQWDEFTQKELAESLRPCELWPGVREYDSSGVEKPKSTDQVNAEIMNKVYEAEWIEREKRARERALRNKK